jgi:hypothetical protein
MIALLYLFLYFIIAALVNGYARTVYDGDWMGDDDLKRFFCTVLWPIGLAWLWVFRPISNFSFNTIEKQASKKVIKNQARLQEINKVRVSLEQSNQELREAEEELERELEEQRDFAR